MSWLRNMRKPLTIFLMLAFCTSAFASLNVRTVWELNPSATAGNVNGGGFDPYTSIAAMIADLECTSGTTSTPSCGSVTYTFVDPGDVGDWLFISSGTGFTANQFCQIASISSGRAILTAGVGTCNIIPNGATGTTEWTTNTVAGLGAASPSSGVFSVDRSRGTAADQTSTTATNTAGVITVGGFTYNDTYIGNIVQIVAGTGATQGWYAITDSDGSTNFTLDRDPSGTTNISINLGGAISLGSATANRTDDIFFELGAGTNGTGASRFYVKSGTYTTLTAISLTATGGTQAPVRISGYNTVRGEAPTGSSRPNWPTGTTAMVLGTNWEIYNINISGTVAGSLLTIGSNGKAVNIKVLNNTTSAGRAAVQSGIDNLILNSEMISYRGIGLAPTGNALIQGNYIHDSNIGISDSTTSAATFYVNNIVESCVTDAILLSAAKAGTAAFVGNTLYGSANTTGVGLLITTGSTDLYLTNNIITGFVTGITSPDAQAVGFDDYNNYYNNDSDHTASKWQKGVNDLAVNPSFTNVAQVTGATATITSGNHIVQSGATFVSSGVTAGRDYVYYHTGSGAGVKGIYGILSVDSETQITVDLALTADANADHQFQITTGHNFLPTATTLVGFPGAFPAALTTGYDTIGAAQRNAASTSTGGVIGAQ